MTKKASRKQKDADTPSNPARKRLLKIFLSDEELKQVTVAAAIEGQRPTVFARKVILTAAQAAIESFKS